MKYSLIILIFTLTSGNAQAKDCELVPKKTFCGVALESSKIEFFKVIGDPSAEIKISSDKVGYVYVSNVKSIVTMLIFTNNHIDEIRTWEANPNIDFWHQLPQVEAVNIKIKGFSFIGKPRNKIEEMDAVFTVEDADQFGDNRKYLGAHISTFYAPFYGPSTYAVGDLNAYEKYTCQTVTITNVNGRP